MPHMTVTDRKQKSEMLAMFGDEYKRYRELTPMFFPKAGKLIPI